MKTCCSTLFFVWLASTSPPVMATDHATELRPATKAKVTLEKIHSSGWPGEKVAREVFRSNNAAVQECYRRALVKAPKLSGKVSVSAWILSTGKVYRSTYTKDESTIAEDASVVKCLMGAVATWKFPAGGTKIGRVRYLMGLSRR